MAVLALMMAAMSLPLVDISADSSRQTVVAAGTKEVYQGHPTTLLAPDGKTLFAVWCLGHGGPCGPMAVSADAGRTWRRVDERLPKAYAEHYRNCPTLQQARLADGRVRFFIFSNDGHNALGEVISDDLGATWREVPAAKQLRASMPPTGFMVLKDGTLALFGQYDRPGSGEYEQTVWMATSKDGGLTWSEMRTVAKRVGCNLCEPHCLRSPDGRSLALLMRENYKRGYAMIVFSDDEGKTWTTPRRAPEGLAGDRHESIRLPDGRYFIAFRNQRHLSVDRGQYFGWVGTWSDLREGGEGQYRVHLLRHFGLGRPTRGGDWDTGYSGVELLPDGTIVCTTYSRHFKDERQSSIVSTRFKIAELDALAKVSTARDDGQGPTADEFYNAPVEQPRATLEWVRPVCIERGRYLGWPTVCRLRSGELLAVFSGDRDWHVCPWGKVQLIRSTDEGETWTDPVTIANGPIDDRDAGIVEMPDGELVVTYFTSVAYRSPDILKKHPEYARHDAKLDPETVDRALGYTIIRSRDGGKTWSKPVRQPELDQSPHGPILLSDGSLFQLGRRYSGSRYGEAEVGRTIVSAWRSTDVGRTWTCLNSDIPLPIDAAKREVYEEPHAAQLADGTIVGHLRHQGPDNLMRQIVSKDGGRTWSPVVKTAINGYPPHLLALGGQRLLCVYGRRFEPGFGEFAVVSEDGGETWDTEHEICLARSHSSDLGYPSTVALGGGRYLTLYYQQPDVDQLPCLMATKWRLK